MQKIIRLLSSGEVQTHDLLNMSILPQPLDQGSRSLMLQSLLLPFSGREHAGFHQVRSFPLAPDLHRQLVQRYDLDHPLLGWTLHRPQGRC